MSNYKFPRTIRFILKCQMQMSFQLKISLQNSHIRSAFDLHLTSCHHLSFQPLAFSFDPLHITVWPRHPQGVVTTIDSIEAATTRDIMRSPGHGGFPKWSQGHRGFSKVVTRSRRFFKSGHEVAEVFQSGHSLWVTIVI